jgi:hypothetical protein
MEDRHFPTSSENPAFTGEQRERYNRKKFFT